MEDREELLRVVNSAFTRDEARPFDFLRILPHLFEPGRIGDHILCVENGRILGCVGLYPYEVRVCGVPFHAAGVGQVGTLKEARGQGVMTSLLKTACRDADAAGYDFCWLGGDRIRYGRFGWATGGARMRFTFFGRYLGDLPPVPGVRPLEAQRDLERVQEHLAHEPNTVVVSSDVLGKILQCAGVGGWVSEAAFIAYRHGGRSICLGGGTPEEIARLLAHHLRWLQAQPEGEGDLTVDCAPASSALMAACQRHYGSVSVVPSGMFRLGPLLSFLRKACQVAQAKVPCGSGSVSLADSETGEAVTVTCRNGHLSVREGNSADSYSLARRELSEACFGLCPLDVFLPALPQDSFLRQVLPLPAHWSRFFSV